MHKHLYYSNKTKFLIIILFNIIITITEYIGGVISGSLALISDAAHNLSDVLSLILGYAGEKISEKGKSESYTFGFKRFEVLTAFINSLFLFFIGVYIFYEAIERFRNPVEIDFSIMLPIAIVGFIGNLISVLILSFKNGSEPNLNIRAAFLHLFYDTVSSIAVIFVAIIFFYTSNYIIDIVISFFIGVMIVWSSLSIIKESLRIILQGTPGFVDSAGVYGIILSVKGVQSLHSLHIWSINSKEVFLSCHICINPQLINLSDEIINEINTLLFLKFKIEHTAIQAEFSDFCNLN